MTERTYTTEEAAAILGVPADLISKWRHRRRVTPAGLVPGRGRGGMVPTYRLEDLRPRADAYRRRQARHADRPDPSE